MKHSPIKSIILTLFIIFITINIWAQFPTDQVYQTFLSETPALPTFNESVVDTSVPESITITQITEYIPEWDWYPTHDYAKIQPWNADASIYRLHSVAIYDAETHDMIRQLPGGSIYPSYWSNTNADLLYSFRENGDIRTYSVSEDSVETIDHIDGYELIKLGPGEGNFDKNDKYVALIGKDGQNMAVIIYDLQELEIIHTEIYEGAWGDGDEVPDYVDWVSVSQSGDYVGIMWNHNTTSEENPFNGHYGVEIYNTEDLQYLRRVASYGNHGDFGYSANGEEVFVQFWGPTGTLNLYYLDRIERLVLSSNSDFSGEGHISCRNINRPGWAYVSQDESVHSGQIVAVKLDDSGLVEHFGHHYSSASTYAKSPMPVPTPNGDKIMFKSDFGNIENTEEVFVFESVTTSSLEINKPNISKIKLYPNPASTVLYLDTETPISNIEIINKLGQTVKQFDTVKFSQINIEALLEGTYYIKIKTFDEFRTLKLFIVR